MTDLHEAGNLAIADIGDSASQLRQDRLDGVERRSRPRCCQGELARADDRGVAAHGGGEELTASLVRGRSDVGGGRGGHGRRVDEHCGVLVGRCQHTPLAERDGFEIFGGRHHREDDVAICQLNGTVHHARALARERIRLGACAVVDGHVIAGGEQSLNQGRAHSAGSDPADRGVVSHRHASLSS